MKNWLIGLVLGVAVLGGAAQVVHASFAYPAYWEMWLQKYQPAASKKPQYRASRSRTTYRRGQSGASVTTAPSVTTPTRTTTTTRVAAPSNTAQRVILRVTRIQRNDPVRVIDTTPLQLFDLGFQHTATSRSTTLVEAAEVRTLTFEIVESSGIGTEWGQLELVIGDEVDGTPVQFDQDGTVTVSLQKLRLARGESDSLPVWLRVRDASLVPHIAGAIRVRLTDVTAVGEQTGKNIRVQQIGTPISSRVAFDPIPSETGGSSSVSAVSLSRIEGKMLAASAQSWVLATDFEAHYDDMLLREIVVKNVLSGSDIDTVIDKFEAVDLQSGRVLGTTRFVGGQAKFRFSPEVSIAREDSVRIGFRATVTDQIRSSQIGTQFRLSVDPADVEVRGIGSGQLVPNSNKTFSLDLATFTVASSVTSVSVSSIDGRLGAVGQPERVLQFTISNPGQRYVSLGRVSFSVNGSGVEFVGGGATPDDFDLERLSSSGNGNSVDGTILVEGLGTVRFDFDRPFMLAPGASQRFALRAATENYGSNNDSDAVVTQILSDDTSAIGTLGALRGQGKNFIWSDAGTTNENSPEWISGYLVPGLPTNQFVFRRDGK